MDALHVFHSSPETQSREDDLIIRRLKNSEEGVQLLPAAVCVGGCCGLFFVVVA